MKWIEIFKNEYNKKYFNKIINFLKKCKKKNINIFPKYIDIFNAFKLTDFEKIKVVIIGQDPYYKRDQANGLCFSVNENVKVPPSLKNIFYEIEKDLKIKYKESSYLKRWAIQGVLLINLILTVEENKPLSHYDIGWKIFTKNIISHIDKYLNNIIFLIWGNFVKKNIIDILKNKNNYILFASHPSNYSFKKSFLVVNIFLKLIIF